MGSQKETKELLSRLEPKAVKILISGNHDHNPTWMRAAGFAVVLNSASMIVSKQLLTMSHYPLLGVKSENTEGMKQAVPGENFHGEHRYSKIAVQNHAGFHCHGHIHANGTKINGHQYNVGVMHNDYSPVSIKTIDQWVQRTLAKEIKNAGTI